MSAPETPDNEGLGDLLARLVDDGRDYARAEIDFYRTLLRSKLLDARAMLWMGAVAMGLAFAAMVALVVGLVLTLAPRIGPGWATLVVVLGIGVVAVIMARLAWVRVKRIFGEEQ